MARLRTRSSYWVLALLALRRGREVARHWLAETIWPDSMPESALYNLRRSLTEIRSAIGPAADRYVVITRRTVKLDPRFVSVDLWRFDSKTHQSQREANSMPSSEIMGLYVGDLLEGCEEEWILGEREGRRHAFVGLALQAARAASTGEELALATGYLRKARRYDSLSEPIAQALIRVLMGAGDFSSAKLVYREFAAELHKELNESPSPATRQLYEDLLVQPRGLDAESRTTPSNLRADRVAGLPLPRSLFGRDQLLEEIQKAIGVHRLTTLVGPGGIGKTSLASTICHARAGAGDPGLRLVELGGITDSSVLTSFLSQQMGFRESSDSEALRSLCDAIGDQSYLIVLDNCEHLIDALAPIVQTILEKCPNVMMLATSTQPLLVNGEKTFRVDPLPIPVIENLEQVSEGKSVLGSPCLRLFESRAQLADSSFELDERNVRSVIGICRLLGGIPLAIELASNLIRSMTPREIESELELGLMRLSKTNVAPARHRSLHSLVAWSFELLSAPEQAMLAALAVFSGGWSLEAAKAVCAVSAKTMDASSILSSIVAKSLVQRASNGESSRYFMLEPIRQFSWDQLEQQGRVSVTRQAHLDYFCELCCQAGAGMAGPDEDQWLDMVSLELDNIRAALAYALSHADCHETALKMVAGLGRFWLLQGMLTEGREYVRRALEAAPPTESIERANAVSVAGLLVARQGDMNGAESFQSEALESYRRLGCQKGEALTLNALGLVHSGRGEYHAARARLEEALALNRILRDLGGEATVLNNLGLVAWYQGQFSDARHLHEQSLEIKRRLHIPRSIGFSLTNLGLVAMAEGHFDQAEAYLTESLDIRRQIFDSWGIADSLTYLGTIARHRQNFDVAKVKLNESLAIYHAIDCHPGTAFAMNQLALISLHEGDLRSARDMLIQCLDISRRSNDWRSVSQNLISAGATLLHYGLRERAVEAWASSERIRSDTHSALQPSEQAELDSWIAEVLQQVGQDKFQAAWTVGENRDNHDAVTRVAQYLAAAV